MQCVWVNSFEFYEMKTPDKIISHNVPNNNDQAWFSRRQKECHEGLEFVAIVMYSASLRSLSSR